MKNWVERQAEKGTHANSSDYVRALIRRDQERAEAISWLQAETDKGRDGEATPLNAADFRAAVRDRARNRADRPP